MGGNQELSSKRNAEAQKMRHHNQQQRRLPYSPYTMALGGVLIAAPIGYIYYAKKKPEGRGRDFSTREDTTHQRK